jgi:hypothetical protein
VFIVLETGPGSLVPAGDVFVSEFLTAPSELVAMGVVAAAVWAAPIRFPRVQNAVPVRIDTIPICGGGPGGCEALTWALTDECIQRYKEGQFRARVVFAVPVGSASHANHADLDGSADDDVEVGSSGGTASDVDCAMDRDPVLPGVGPHTDLVSALLDSEEPVGAPCRVQGTVLLVGLGTGRALVEEEEALLLQRGLVDVSVHPRNVSDIVRVLAVLQPRVVLVLGTHRGRGGVVAVG